MKKFTKQPPSFMFYNKKNVLKYVFSVLVLCVCTSITNVNAQSTIYSTNFGTSAVNLTTLLAGPPAWTRSGANAANAQLSTASASGTYAGASAGANLLDNGGTGAAIVTTGNISTVGYAGPITMTFGYRQSSGTYTGTVKCEYSVDGERIGPRSSIQQQGQPHKRPSMEHRVHGFYQQPKP